MERMAVKDVGKRWLALAVGLVLVLAGCSGGRAGRSPSTATATTAPGTSGQGGAAAGAARCPLGPLPAPAADRPRYQLRIDLQPQRALVTGQLRVRFAPDLATDRLVFRLWPNNQRFQGAGAKLDTGAPVDPDGRELVSSHPDPTTLEVRPQRGLSAGESIELSLPWRLRLPSPSIADRISSQAGTLRLGSFFPLLAWQPGVGWATDPPASGLGEASTSPVADFDVTVTAPRGLDVLATGSGNGRGHWRATAVRDFALSAGDFRTATAVAHAPGPVRVSVGVDSTLRDRPADYARIAVRALEDYSRRFAPYPWPTLTIGITPNLPGGIEYPTHIMQGPGTAAGITPHEVGHMWFYSLVGNDQARDPWLDEGLATYAEARFDGVTSRYQRFEVPQQARGRLGEPMSFWDRQSPSLYFPGVYAQGAKALLALGGPGVADCVLRVYLAREGYRIARPANLLAAATTVVPRAPAIFATFGIPR
jgi:Peptidase family M1 domain